MQAQDKMSYSPIKQAFNRSPDGIELVQKCIAANNALKIGCRQYMYLLNKNYKK